MQNGVLVFKGNLFYNVCHSDGNTASGTAEGDSVTASQLSAYNNNNSFDADPKLAVLGTAGGTGVNAWSAHPRSRSPALSGAVTLANTPFLNQTSYKGAFDGVNDWTTWTKVTTDTYLAPLTSDFDADGLTLAQEISSSYNTNPSLAETDGGDDTSTGGGDTSTGGGDISTGGDSSVEYTSGTPKIVRMSVRGHIGTGDDERFMRFAVNGDVNVMVRAIGPALGDLSADLAPISLIDPNLSIFKGQDELPAYHNDNYTARSEASDIESISQSLSVVIPIKPVESASIGDYSTGTYYANVRDKSYSASYGTRVGWVGADITDTSASGGFSGVSTRGVIKPGDGSMFASFEIVGDANSTRRMFIRARGASLANFGVKNVLSNINLKLFYLGGDLIKQSNDYTSESNKGEIETQAKALFGDLDSTDAGMIIDLKPAYYTIWVESETGATGVGWIGVDDITQ
jgi:hypothetical protein